MVSIPSFLRMAAVDHQRTLHRLRTTKGHLSSLMTHLLELMTDVGERPCPDNTRHGEHFEVWGEILYKLTIISAYVSNDLETLTNEIRIELGLKAIDYSDSLSNQIIKDWFQLMKEQAPQFGAFVTDDGKLVRS